MVILYVNTQLYRILICVFMSHAKHLEADIDNMKHQRVAVNSGEGFSKSLGFQCIDWSMPSVIGCYLVFKLLHRAQRLSIPNSAFYAFA